ncbi:MAG: HNH endonuclease domain-containing protein [Lachnospiraceae bacterium]|nr:HNH endonuclease domain-containing protein [Lachnospiraceae bacterium]
MVTEYHLNLGPSDTLEALVHHISHISGMKSSEKRETILEFLHKCEDKKVLTMKRTLTKNVPYRLQAPFFQTLRGNTEWKVPEKEIVEKIRQEERLIYYISELAGMESQIEIQDEWFQYLLENQEIILGWIHFNMITYLQRRNPNVPGISDKLKAPQERKLEKVKKYWNLIASIKPIKEIYGNNIITPKDISIDHFIPWSYVANDELWNLHPTTRTINSSKSNNLPDWDIYFQSLSKIEFAAYKLVWEHEKIHDAFDKCVREHINSADVQYKLYRQGVDFQEFTCNLEEIMHPIYQAAQNVGFRRWKYDICKEG